MELKDLVGIAKEVAEQQKGEHHPQFFLEEQGKLQIYCVPFENEEEKQIFVELVLPKLIEQKQVDRYFSVFGAWMAVNQKPPAGKRVSDMDDKQEIIVVSEHTKQGSHTVICPFVRDGDHINWQDEVWTNPEEQSSFDRFNVWVHTNIVIKDGGKQ